MVMSQVATIMDIFGENMQKQFASQVTLWE